MEKAELINRAKTGDINSFHELFKDFQKELKSYIYRLVTDRNDCQDLFQDVFVRAFDKIQYFEGKATLKTWVFSIATNICIDFLRGRKRWGIDSQDRSKKYAQTHKEVGESFMNKNKYSPYGAFDIKEHIDFCFTCMSKTLPIEQQIALILKDIFDFTVNDISDITERTAPAIKHYLHDARKTMTDIFDHRCAIVNKQGICHQCSELSGYFNSKQNIQSEMLKVEMLKSKQNNKSKEDLFKLRTKLIKYIDPLNAEGSDLHEIFMQITRKVEGEIEEISYK